jgi:hypothetical protein
MIIEGSAFSLGAYTLIPRHRVFFRVLQSSGLLTHRKIVHRNCQRCVLTGPRQLIEDRRPLLARVCIRRHRPLESFSGFKRPSSRAIMPFHPFFPRLPIRSREDRGEGFVMKIVWRNPSGVSDKSVHRQYRQGGAEDLVQLFYKGSRRVAEYP